MSMTVLVAEDDADDRMMVEDAFTASRLVNELRFVHDGQELLDYLRRQGAYAGIEAVPRPNVILLDLNMPRKNGFEALKEIKKDPDLRQIPIVIFTTSKEDEDIFRCYDYGGNSFITKPVTFGGLVDIVKSIENYWFDVVELPPRRRAGGFYE